MLLSEIKLIYSNIINFALKEGRKVNYIGIFKINWKTTMKRDKAGHTTDMNNK